MAERVGWIGLGIMGSRMAANLRGAGFDLVVYNRTKSTAREWAAEHGAAVADTPAEVASACDVVVSMVVDGRQVESVLLRDDGVRAGARAGLLCIDMSTIGPRFARRIGAALGGHGVSFLDAPVTGSAPRAQDATLTIMAGGEAAAFERARPLLEAMGRLIVHVGALGQGQMVKLINNSVAAANASTVAQALVVGQATGVDGDALVAVLGSGSAASAMLELKAGAMRNHDYRAQFKLAHMLKDVDLCLDEGRAAGVPFPVAAAARETLVAGMGRGQGDEDFCALVEVLEGLAAVRLRSPQPS